MTHFSNFFFLLNLSLALPLGISNAVTDLSSAKAPEEVALPLPAPVNAEFESPLSGNPPGPPSSSTGL